jgi:hypothetical protein
MLRTVCDWRKRLHNWWVRECYALWLSKHNTKVMLGKAEEFSATSSQMGLLRKNQKAILTKFGVTFTNRSKRIEQISTNSLPLFEFRFH